jgi:hypothetical protein
MFLRALVAFSLLSLCSCSSWKLISRNTPTISSLANHKYWKEPRSEKEIEFMVSEILKLDKDAWVKIHSSGKIELEHESLAADSRLGYYQYYGHRARLVVFDMSDYQIRPTREEIIIDFLKKLDQEEFKPREKELIFD